jgi:replicative DNA helicase
MNPVPPNDVETERALIGHMLYVNSSADLDLTGLQASHFYDPSYRSIWDAIRSLDGKNQSFDAVSVASHLNDQQKLQGIGGAAKLADLGMGSSILGEISINSHSQRLVALWKARQFIGACQVGQVEMHSGGVDAIDEIIRRYDQVISDLMTSGSEGPVRFFDAVADAMKRLSSDEIRACSSGFPTFDHATGGGFHSGELIIVAGRPGMGKTAFLLNTLVNLTSRSKGEAGAMFSLEMPTFDLTTRILCSEARLQMSEMRCGKVQPEYWKVLTGAANKLANIPLWIDDTSAITVQEIRARIRAIKRDIVRVYGDTKKLKVVGIDYLQLMRGKNSPNREQEVSSITREAKALAKDEDVCLIALSQLNRDTEKQNNKRPGLKDLRESGAIEQDADAVMFVYRPGYYDDGEDQSVGELILAKQRNGATSTIYVHWDPQRMRYSDNDKTHEYLDELEDIAEDWYR